MTVNQSEGDRGCGVSWWGPCCPHPFPSQPLELCSGSHIHVDATCSTEHVGVGSSTGMPPSSEKNCRYNVGQRLQSSKQSLMTQTFKKEVQYLIPPLCDWETTPFFSLSSLFKKMR